MNNKKSMYIFLTLLPIIDLITSLITRFNLTTISLGIVVKSIFLLIMLYYLVIKSYSKHKKKSIIYISIIFLYIILYFLTKIKYLTPITLYEEIMYMFKLLYFPILLPCLLCYFDDKKFSKNELTKILLLNVITYGLLLFIPLLTNTNFKTYYSSLLGSSGWFYSGNEISIILILIFPFSYILLKRKKIYYILVPILLVFIISTIGTKASMIGILIDTIIIFILSLFYRKNKKTNFKLITYTFFILLITLSIFMNSHSLENMKITLGIEQIQDKELIRIDKEIEEKRLQERRLIKEEISRIEVKEKEESTLMKFYNSYGKSLLSDRDIYFKVTYKIYDNNYNINTLLFGIGYTNNKKIHSFAINKLIEIDPLDIYFHSGLIALVIILMPLIYYLYHLIKSRKITIENTYYFLMIGMTFAVSCISGHTLMAPAVSIYITLYFILALNELDLINKKTQNIEKNKVTIYALHLNYGGVEKNICMKANILSELYNVEIISLYKLNDKPQFDLNDKVKVKYLTTNIKPNKKEFIDSLKNKKIFKTLKEGFKSIHILNLKRNVLTKSIINCNSEIIISTRVDFTENLLKNNEYYNIKIAEEHIYHNNNTKYLNRLYKILKSIDYLMPSSKYLTSYYKDIFNDYSYKIITNNMPIETNNKISNLKNKNIITVGRLDKVKGYDDLIKLFVNVDKDWTLNIVGDGPEYSNLLKLIKDLNLDNVNLLGFKTPKELNDLYKDASIYVMTSLEESFGLVLIEAASHGLPIVAYDSALGAKEILKDESGILISNRDESEMTEAINKLINSIELRKEYQKKSLSIAKIYSYDKIKQDNINFFKDIRKSNMYTNLYTGSKKDCYKLIENKLKKGEKQFIITANPETYMLSKINKSINDMLYDKNNLIVPDGISIVKTANFLGKNVKERISGIDIAEHLLKLANDNKYKVYLFGASEEVLNKLTKVIETKYPNINLVGATNGYIKDKDNVMNYIKLLEPDIIMIALGIPLQEKLIYNHINDIKKGIMIGVGGSFDVLSGSKKRAPRIFIKFNLEWLYRIVSEPKRLIRFIKHNIRFLIVIFKEKIYRNVDK